MTKFAGKMAKIQSITLDTNVIIDIEALAALTGKLDGNEKLTDEDKEYFQRCRASKKAIFVMLDFNVRRIGLRVVYKELLAAPPMHNLYRNLFPEEARITKECRNLAERYSKIGIPPADAAIVALASINRVDILLSWNRKHVANREKIAEVEKLNSKQGYPTPEIMTPDEFLARLMKTDKKCLALSPSPLPPIYQMGSYLSKHGV